MGKGYKHTQEAKDKMSAAKRGKNHPQFGKPISQETKDKISAAKMGKKHSQETKDKLSAANMGKKLSQETKDKLSAANMGKKHSQETIKKISINVSGNNNPSFGKKQSQSTIEKRNSVIAVTRLNKCRVSIDNIHFYSFRMFAQNFGVTGFHEAEQIFLTGQPSKRQLSDIKERNKHKIVYIDVENRSLQEGV